MFIAMAPNQTKFTHRTQVCVFVGYPLHQRDYRCFHPSSRKHFVTMNVIFSKDCPFFTTSVLEGETVIEEFNYMFSLKFICPIVVTLSDPSPHSTILSINQVP